MRFIPRSPFWHRQIRLWWNRRRSNLQLTNLYNSEIASLPSTSLKDGIFDPALRPWDLRVEGRLSVEGWEKEKNYSIVYAKPDNKKLCPLALKTADKAGEFRSEEREWHLYIEQNPCHSPKTKLKPSTFFNFLSFHEILQRTKENNNLKSPLTAISCVQDFEAPGANYLMYYLTRDYKDRSWLRENWTNWYDSKCFGGES